MERQVMKYAAVFEKAGNNYSGYVPDLPGCISTGRSLSEIESNMREAIAVHLEGMREDGMMPPHPTTHVAEI
jgi:predicted RNase H-like HicB family nuclease